MGRSRKEIISGNIKALRKGRYKSGRDFAKAIGIAQQQISTWESGKVVISEKNQKLVEAHFDKPSGWLLEDHSKNEELCYAAAFDFSKKKVTPGIIAEEVALVNYEMICELFPQEDKEFAAEVKRMKTIRFLLMELTEIKESLERVLDERQ